MANDPTDTYMPAPQLVLGSTSPYRRELLARLGVPFEVCPPDIDESPHPGEDPAALAQRLALEKARAVVQKQPHDVIIIASDQVADLDGVCLGKPGHHERAREQLRAQSGRVVRFHTAVAVVRPATSFVGEVLSTVTVQMRTLTDEDIETYLHRERPYDCAGSAKCEGLGISLLERIDSQDPTALVGLPLIEVSRLMRQAGLDPLRWPGHATQAPSNT